MKYKIVAFELWGNAKDGFDNNMSYLRREIEVSKPLPEIDLMRYARNEFEGRSFAWSENKTTFMTRRNIWVDFTGSSYDIFYHDHIVGEIQVIDNSEETV
jgi:hypothetical protein